MTSSRCLWLALVLFSTGCSPVVGPPDALPDGADAGRDVSPPPVDVPPPPVDVPPPPVDVPAPIDSGVTCRTTGGRVLRLGESVFDGCNTCVCQPDGLLGCTGRFCPDVVPPPIDGGVCIAPDGTSLRPGERWSNVCTACICDVSIGLSCFGTCADAGPPDTGPACNTISFVGLPTPTVRMVPSLPAATGGTIVAGRYELTDVAAVGPPGTPIGMPTRLVMEFGASSMQLATPGSLSAPDQRVTYAYMTLGTTLALRQTCGLGSTPPVFDYSASATGLVLQFSIPGGGAVQMTLTRR